jgi:pyridoxal phosphate enzyme (YggS family)
LERIEAALAAGQRVFGENYVQEAKGRWPRLREHHPGLELHMIGGLQSNKAAEAVALFDVIQTVDRPKLARELAKEMARQDRRPRLLVQVNTGEEPQKSGIGPGELGAFLDLCRGELGLAVEGLMAIPPEDEDVALHAALLAKLARRHGLAALSIGMSGDFEAAIRFGATHVRVGTAIFGARGQQAG